MSGCRVAIAAATGVQPQLLADLSRRLRLPITSVDDRAPDLLLMITASRLELHQTGPGKTGPVYADFAAGRVAHRRRFGGGRGQPLGRAIGLKQGRNPYVLDATAGLGRDAFVFATLGCRVTMVERSPVVAALLQDALARALEDDQVAPVVQRMNLVCTDAVSYLDYLGLEQSCPDVIYLDPMYPHRGKTAQAKKEMRLFRRLVGDDDDSLTLLLAARDKARYRVVVKRPARARALGDQAPSMCIRSPNTRYDVYINKGFVSKKIKQ